MNLAKICERYGGGGHARVGAISFNVNQHAAAIKGFSRDRERTSRRGSRREGLNVGTAALVCRIEQRNNTAAVVL